MGLYVNVVEVVGSMPNSKGTGRLSFCAGRMVCDNAVCLMEVIRHESKPNAEPTELPRIHPEVVTCSYLPLPLSQPKSILRTSLLATNLIGMEPGQKVMALVFLAAGRKSVDW